MKKLAYLLLLLFSIQFATPANGSVMMIDLRAPNFFADPSVTVAANGLSALIEEDANLGAVLLVNDPGLGDPNVILPGAGVSLKFEYDFTLGGVGNFDEFGAFLIDSNGVSLGAPFEFFASSTSSGTISFDLTSLVGQTIGLQFQLSALIGDQFLDSTATISNVRLDDGTVNPIPEPSSLVCWTLVAGFGLVSFRRSRRRMDSTVE